MTRRASRLVGRAFLGVTAGATLSALVGHEPRLLQAQAPRPNATADAVIVLWMAGGMAQTETWDPKRYTPFEPGVRTERVLSTFPSIDTVVDHIKISQGLERVARVMDRGAIIRTFQAADLGYILHSRHQCPLAHRLHSAAVAGDAASAQSCPERGEEPQRPCIHRHRSEPQIGGRPRR
jgi:hypothetical protein